MLKRIVKLTFEERYINDFLQIFEESRNKIRVMQGNRGVELLQDLEKPNIMFTFSLWESAADLENYRQSELFIGTWKRTKALFSEKASAWSTECVNQSDEF